jgi:hypothetical protein
MRKMVGMNAINNLQEPATPTRLELDINCSASISSIVNDRSGFKAREALSPREPL